MENFEKLMHDLCEAESNIQRWICTYEQKSALTGIIRNVPPTLATVSVNDNTKNILQGIISGTNVQAYSSKGFSIKIVENGKVKSIGLDSKSGQVLQFFEDEMECRRCYNDMLRDIISELKLERERLITDIEERLNKLKEQIV